MNLGEVNWSKVAAVVGTGIALAGFMWSVFTYQETAEREAAAAEEQATTQAESAAVSALGEHFSLAAEHAEVEWDSGNLEYRRLASHALFTADTIDDLVNNVPKSQQNAWRNTLKGVVAEHAEFIARGKFPCDEFDEGFINDYMLDNDKFIHSDRTAVQEALNSNSACP